MFMERDQREQIRKMTNADQLVENEVEICKDKDLKYTISQ